MKTATLARPLLVARVRVALMRQGKCNDFCDYVRDIRRHIDDGLFTYEELDITEIELLELAVLNATNKLKRCVRPYTDLRIQKLFVAELNRKRSGSMVPA